MLGMLGLGGQEILILAAVACAIIVPVLTLVFVVLAVRRRGNRKEDLDADLPRRRPRTSDSHRVDELEEENRRLRQELDRKDKRD